MKISKPFLTGACLSFFGLLILSELLLRLAVPTGSWYGHLDLSGDLTSLAELRDRIHYGPGGTDSRPVLFLGDSVLGASALVEHRVPQARQKTLSHLAGERLKEKAALSLSLGSDGLLLPDIQGICAEVDHAPRAIVLLLNFRMFSKDLAEGPKALSRNFLLKDLPADIRARLGPEKPPSEEAKLSDGLYAWMCQHWFLFRETQAAKVLWYYPSQKDLYQRGLEKLVGKNEDQSDILEAALKQKVAPYYQAYLWDPKALPMTCLKNILEDWAGRHIPVVIVLTPQDRKFLGSYLDKPSFEKNRKTLAAFLRPYRGAGITYQDWVDRYPPSFFLDHCHLTPEGNERYAKDLLGLLGKERAW